MSKLAEGGFNKVLRLVMDDGRVVIARIPLPIAGSLSHTVASEVATMDFASTILGIPVPKVLAWSTTKDNPAQTEYIIMEEAVGTLLTNQWDTLDTDAKSEIVDELVAVSKKLLAVSFSRYGNLYFSCDSFPGCEEVSIEGAMCAKIKSDAQSRFVIGPTVDQSFWNGERRGMGNFRGPWARPQDYLVSVANREMRWLGQYADPSEPSRPFQAMGQRSPDVHIGLYRKFLQAIDKLLPEEKELVKPTLWHWDLHAPNIFVKDNKITSIIDWQDCWAGPLLLQGWRPRLLDYKGELMFELPPHYKSLPEGDEKKQICSAVEKSLLLFSYESQIQIDIPLLGRIFQLPQIMTIRETVQFASNTWNEGLIPFRECLLRLHRHWNEIRPGEPCPFDFTPDERSAHLIEGEGWNENAEFWSSISELVSRDGYVAKEDYDTALEMFRTLREKGLQTLEGDERAEFEIATRWAAR